jgi:hypothetical protein
MCEAIKKNGWNNTFNAESKINRLNVLNLESVDAMRFGFDEYVGEEIARCHQFASITTLQLNASRSLQVMKEQPKLCVHNLWVLFQFLPNLTTLEVHHISSAGFKDLSALTDMHQHLHSIKWTGFHEQNDDDWDDVPDESVTELYLDGGVFAPPDRLPINDEIDANDIEGVGCWFPLMNYLRLERLSVCHCCWQVSGCDPIELTQSLLIRMALGHTSLKWMRANFSDDTMALVKRRRPNLMLMNDIPSPGRRPRETIPFKEGDLVRIYACKIPFRARQTRTGTVVRMSSEHVFINLDYDSLTVRASFDDVVPLR